MGFIQRNLAISPFLRSVGVIAGGTAAGQAILLAASPILSRLYVPEDFGLVAVYLSLSTILGSVAAGRYELAIPLPREHREATNLAALALLSALIFSFLVAVALLCINEVPAMRQVFPEVPTIFWLVPFGVLFQSAFQTLTYLSLRNKRFARISSSRAGKSGVMASVQLAGFPLGSVNLVFGALAGQVFGTLALATSSFRQSEIKSVSWPRIKLAADTYRKFPLFTSWAGLLNTMGTQFPPLFLAALFSPASAGYYLLANRVIGMPVSLISGAVGNIYLSHGAALADGGQLGDLTQKIICGLVRISLLPAVFLCLFGPWIFVFVFGSEWHNSGLIVQWLILMVFFQFIFSPLSTIFGILEKNHVGLALQALLFAVRALTLSIGIWKADLISCIALFSIGSAACYFMFGFMIFKTAGIPFSRLFSTLSAEILLSAGCLLPVLPLVILSDVPSFWVFLAVSGTVALGICKYLFQFKSVLIRQTGR